MLTLSLSSLDQKRIISTAFASILVIDEDDLRKSIIEAGLHVLPCRIYPIASHSIDGGNIPPP